MQENPEIIFEITLAHPHIDFWTEKSEKETEKILEKYQKSAELLLMFPNARLYFLVHKSGWYVIPKLRRNVPNKSGGVEVFIS